MVPVAVLFANASTRDLPNPQPKIRSRAVDESVGTPELTYPHVSFDRATGASAFQRVA